MCKRLIDSEDIASPEEEIEQCSLLVYSALDRFHFDKTSPDKALDFHVSTRTALLNNDRLQEVCVGMEWTFPKTRRLFSTSSRGSSP